MARNLQHEIYKYINIYIDILYIIYYIYICIYIYPLLINNYVKTNPIYFESIAEKFHVTSYAKF